MIKRIKPQKPINTSPYAAPIRSLVQEDSRRQLVYFGPWEDLGLALERSEPTGTICKPGRKPT